MESFYREIQPPDFSGMLRVRLANQVLQDVQVVLSFGDSSAKRKCMGALSSGETTFAESIQNHIRPPSNTYRVQCPSLSQKC